MCHCNTTYCVNSRKKKHQENQCVFFSSEKLKLSTGLKAIGWLRWKKNAIDSKSIPVDVFVEISVITGRCFVSRFGQDYIFSSKRTPFDTLERVQAELSCCRKLEKLSCSDKTYVFLKLRSCLEIIYWRNKNSLFGWPSGTVSGTLQIPIGVALLFE